MAGLFLVLIWLLYNAVFSRSEIQLNLSETSPHKLSYSSFYEEYAKPLLIPRYPGSNGTKETVKFLKESLVKSGLTVHEQKFKDRDPDGKEYDFVNVWAETDPSAKKRVVLSCHHDSKLLFFTKSGKRVPFIGAIDSAIPCAIILYIASLSGPTKSNENSCSINQSVNKLDTSLVFIFFDGEEAFKDWTATDSLYGSRYFANNIDSEKADFIKSIDLFVLLDLIGSKDPVFKRFYHAKDKCYKRLQSIENSLKSGGKSSCNINLNYHKAYQNKYFSNTLLPQNVDIGDDHQPFMKKGVKNVLHLIPVPFPKEWHEEIDNHASLHHPTIENFVQIFTMFVQDLSCVSA